MKQSLQFRLGQQLSMTPQLQQAIRLLQLSSLELQQEIQEALESNMMLEQDEGQDGDAGEEERGDTPASSEERPDSEMELDSLRESIPDDLPVDSEWDSIYDTIQPPSSSSSSQASSQGESDILARTSSRSTLREHLLWQLNLSPFQDTERLIAEAIIDAIDDEGYFRSDFADIAAILEYEGVGEADVERVLTRIQQEFDPVGVGARDLRECMLLQISQMDGETPGRELAQRLVVEQFELLGRQDRDGIRRSLQCSDEALRVTTELIRTLNPRPGSQIAPSETEYVIPDVFVSKHPSGWRVELNHELTPRIRVNPLYVGLVKRSDSSADNQTLKDHLQQARWLIKSITSRNDTVLRVATQIVEFQRNFFEYGDEAMRPLVQREIAEALELHESTVSRVTTNKYMRTPRGTLEFKYFFSSHVGTASGGECSATAIRALIKKLVAAEKPKKPLSDSKISLLLKEQGINVARRTVAKYRESMAIAPSNERKRLA